MYIWGASTSVYWFTARVPNISISLQDPLHVHLFYLLDLIHCLPSPKKHPTQHTARVPNISISLQDPLHVHLFYLLDLIHCLPSPKKHPTQHNRSTASYSYPTRASWLPAIAVADKCNVKRDAACWHMRLREVCCLPVMCPSTSLSTLVQD